MDGHVLAGRYRLLSVVGRGGMGTVWRAVDETLDREVAVKEVVLPHGLADEERDNRHRRTLREARASARLGHPGVVTVHDVVDEDGRPWIVMELVQGRSLQDVLDDDGPLPPVRAAAVGRQIVGALRAAHAVGILHRDVKPANVLVTGDDRAVLTDFGIARVAGDATLTGTGMIMGSPAYMAPERVNGDAAGPASDLWALGATLYAACEGRAPHQRDDAMAVLAAVLTQDPPRPRNAGPLAPVLRGLLERDPVARMDARRAEEALAAVESGRAAEQTAGPVAGQSATAGAGAPAPAPVPVPDPPAGTRTGAVQYAGQPDFAGTQQQVAHPGTAGFGGPGGSGGSGGRGLRTPVVIAGSLAVAAIVAVGAFLFWPDGGSGGGTGAGTGQNQPQAQGPDTQPGTSRGPQRQPSVPTDQVATPTTGPDGFPVLPANLERGNGPGYTIGVPRGWNRKVQGRSVIWTDPASSAYVQVDTTQWLGDPYRHWEIWEEQAIADGNMPGFTRLSLDRTTVAGHDAADIEFTWTRSTGPTRARDRGVIINGRAYAIVVALPASQWKAKETLVKNVLDTFRPAGVG